jgi:hypothetical protein
MRLRPHFLIQRLLRKRRFKAVRTNYRPHRAEAYSCIKDCPFSLFLLTDEHVERGFSGADNGLLRRLIRSGRNRRHSFSRQQGQIILHAGPNRRVCFSLKSCLKYAGRIRKGSLRQRPASRQTRGWFFILEMILKYGQNFFLLR